MIHSQPSSEAQCSISEVEKISKIFVLEKNFVFLILEVLKKKFGFFIGSTGFEQKLIPS